jgi:hypothetical protein
VAAVCECVWLLCRSVCGCCVGVRVAAVCECVWLLCRTDCLAYHAASAWKFSTVIFAFGAMDCVASQPARISSSGPPDRVKFPRPCQLHSLYFRRYELYTAVLSRSVSWAVMSRSGRTRLNSFCSCAKMESAFQQCSRRVSNMVSSTATSIHPGSGTDVRDMLSGRCAIMSTRATLIAGDSRQLNEMFTQ